MAFSVRVEGIRFAAAHFATFRGECEPLHGHSYEVAAEAEGPLSQDSWVVDFADLKGALREVCLPLDHKFLLQSQSSEIQIDLAEGAWRVRTSGRKDYVFPVDDVAALPIDNSTAERLAEYLSGRLEEVLKERRACGLGIVAVEVWEGPGQRARHARTIMGAFDKRLPQD